MQPFELKFIDKEKVATDAWRLNFEKPDWFKYQPGQFNEIFLEHPNEDDRGDHRWFTMSSSPTEEVISITTRHVADHPSTLKNALFALQAGEIMQAKGPDGEFVLPSDTAAPIVWIAGGIGITPFISQMRYMCDSKDLSRNIMLLYGNRTPGDVVCQALLDEFAAANPSFKPVIVLSEQPPADWKGESGMIDEALIGRYVKDLSKPQFYVSGPEPMVKAFVPMLKGMDIPAHNIHTDEFPGYTEKY